MQPDVVETAPTPEIIPPPSAVGAMYAYIIGAQPEMVAYHYHGLHQPQRSAEEPNNVGFYGWVAARNTLDGSLRHGIEQSVRREAMAKLIVEASEASYEWVRAVGLELPLIPPKRFADIPEPLWQAIADKFIDPHDIEKISARDPKNYRARNLPPAARRALIGLYHRKQEHTKRRIFS